MSDSTMSDIGALGLFIGVGTMAARTSKEIKARGAVHRRFHGEGDVLSRIESIERNRFKPKLLEMGHVDQVFAEHQKMFTSLSGKYNAAVKAGEGELAGKIIERMHKARAGADFMNEHLVDSLIHTFDLGSSEAGMNRDLKGMLSLSPKHAEHVESVLESFNLLDTVDRFATKAKKDRIHPFDAFHEIGMNIRQDAISLENAAVLNLKSIDHEFTTRQFDSADDLRNALMGIADREDMGYLTERAEALRQRMNGAGAMRGRFSGDRLVGLSMSFGADGGIGVDIPLRQKGNLYFGEKVTQVYTGGRAPHPEVMDYIKTGKGQIWQRPDTLLMNHLIETLDDVRADPGSWRRTMKSMVGDWRTDTSRLLMPASSNAQINARLDTELVTDAVLGVRIKGKWLPALDERLLLDGHVPVDGVKADGYSKGKRRLNGDYSTPGTSFFGQSVSADKEMSQRNTTRRIINSGSSNHRMRVSAVGLISGKEKAVDLLPRITSYSMPESQMMAALEGLGMHGAYPVAEDTAWLIDKNIKASYQANIHIPIGTQMTEGLESLLSGGFDVDGIDQNTILGFRRDGTPVKTTDQGRFMISGVYRDLEENRITIAGAYEETLGEGYKIFGNKKTLYNGASPDVGRWIAATHRAGMEQGLRGEALAVFMRSSGQSAMANMGTYGEGFLDQAPSGVSKSRFKRLFRETEDIQMLDTQGIKRIQERGLDVMAESLLGELGDSVTRTIGRDEAIATKQLDRLNAMLGKSGIGFGVHNENGASVAEIVVDGTKDRYNIVERSRKIMLASSKEFGVVNRWDIKDTIDFIDPDFSPAMKNLGNRDTLIVAESLLNGALSPEARALLGDAATSLDVGKMQAKLYDALGDGGGILRYGKNRTPFSTGGAAKDVLGSGARGTFASAGLDHLRAQGGVMTEIADELAGRVADDAGDIRNSIHKKLAAFHTGATPTLAAEDAVAALRNKEMIGALFSRSQEERNEAFGRIGKSMNMTPEEIAKMDSIVLGIGDGKGIHLDRGISVLSGPFVTENGVVVKTGLDKATNSYLNAILMDNSVKQSEALAEYGSELMSTAKPLLAKEGSGKTLGAMRLHAAPNHQKTLHGVNIEDSIGISEASYRRMARDLDHTPDQIEDGLNRLRAGNEFGVINRDPNIDMHRVTTGRMHSLDEVARLQVADHAKLMTGKLSPDDALHAYSNFTGVSMGLKGQELEDFVLQNSNVYDENGKMIRLEEVQKMLNKMINGNVKRKLKALDKNMVQIPKSLEASLGVDYDGDNVTVSIINHGKNRRLLKERIEVREAFNQGFRSEKGIHGDGGFDHLQRFIKENQVLIDGIDPRAAEDFMYQQSLGTLYSDVLKGYKSEMLNPEDVGNNTARARTRVRGQIAAAILEKSEVGPMTNTTNFVRDALRETDSGFQAVKGRIFGEMLLGLMPEIVLKARQPGAIGLVEKEMQKHIGTIKDIMGNNGSVAKWSRERKTAAFNDAFKAIFKPDSSAASAVDELLSFTPRIIEAAESDVGSAPQNALARMLKSKDEGRTAEELAEEAKRIVASLNDSGNRSVSAVNHRRHIEALDGPRSSKMKNNIKNAKGLFGDIIEVMGRNKKPALIGLGAALGLSLLSSPGSISADEANSAGARHTPSRPSEEDANFGNSAPVAVGSGRTVRVRGTSQGDIDSDEATRRLREQYPGANVSYTMNDYREKMNEEYLRKRLMR